MRRQTKDIVAWDLMVVKLQSDIVGKKELCTLLRIKSVESFKTYFFNTTGNRLYTLKRSFLYMPKTQEEYEEIQRKLTPYAKGFTKSLIKSTVSAYECRGLTADEIRHRVIGNPMNHYFAKEMRQLGYTM